MKTIKLLFLVLLSLVSTISRSQTIILNGGYGNDTIKINVHFQAISGYTSDTIYYCNSVKITNSLPPNDSIRIAGNTIKSGSTATVNLADSTSFISYVTAFCGDTEVPDMNNLKFHFIKKFPSGNICWVTVDSNYLHNVIIWDTAGLSGQAIDSFKVYFYNSSNQWQKLAEKPYKDTIYYFVDTLNNPNVSTMRYCLTSVNSCGNEEPFANSPWQNTMWISNSVGTFSWSGTGYLIQNNASPVNTYILYRDSIGNGHWDSIASVSGTQFVISDPNYANYPNGRWSVGAVLNVSGCSTPLIAKRDMNATATISHSNRIGKLVSGIATVQSRSSFTAYPNPFTNTINIDAEKASLIELIDIAGRVVFNSTITPGHNTLKLILPDGMYFLRVNGNIVEKMVK
ncbi:MAG: T9SS type A sorting domain-containing protein [Bacteroidia bacterium]